MFNNIESSNKYPVTYVSNALLRVTFIDDQWKWLLKRENEASVDQSSARLGSCRSDDPACSGQGCFDWWTRETEVITRRDLGG